MIDRFKKMGKEYSDPLKDFINPVVKQANSVMPDLISLPRT